ncbi:serine/threonine-protein kinase [Candidatus Pristimantibacillus sp. PTI5]|uniref:serine/threonine-protein kinase n=1 Tax=Candidatus Pristimantibacillus sp. PTI5 TaxID=3400422 RepID=UPI003B02342F
MKLLKDTTLLGISEIISKALGRDSINKIAIRTGLFSMADIEDDFPRHSSKELLVRYIISTFSVANVMSERKKREDILFLINEFYKTLPYTSQKRFEELMLNDEYVSVDNIFTYPDYALEHEVKTPNQEKEQVVIRSQIMRDITRLKASQIISVLHHDMIKEIAVATELFTIAEIEEEYKIHKKKPALVQQILGRYTVTITQNVDSIRNKLLMLLNGFYNTLAISDQLELEKVLEADGYVCENGSISYAGGAVRVSFASPEATKESIKPTPKRVHIKSIGNGYFSNVSTYMDEKTGRKFARKKLLKEHWDNEDYIVRFKREVELLKELQGHPHVVDLFDYDLDTKELQYDMELADDNLYEHIRKNNGKLLITDRLIIFEQILHAICVAHSRSIIHRDLSPKNILTWNTTPCTLVKLADFGLGRSNRELKQHTKSNVSDFGHVLYVAPEQRERLKDGTHLSDIYSLGRLLAFILTGRDPDNVMSNQAFYPIIKKATRREPSDRYDNVELMRDAYLSLKEESLSRYVEEEQRRREIHKTP